MVALKMANPNELSSLEIKLLHALKDGPIGITQICKKLQIVREYAEKLTKNLVTKRFITKQSNSQYRNLIKTAEIPALIKPAEMPAEPAAEPIPEPIPAPLAELKPEPAASCTYPICTCPKDKCEEDPLVDVSAKAEAKTPPEQRLKELTAMLTEEVNHAAAFSADLEQTAKMFGSKAIALQSRNAMAVQQDSPLPDELKQELHLITEQLAQPKAPNIQLTDLDKKLNFISYLRLLLEKLPHTSTLLDEMHADYMELKRQQETA